MGAPHVLCFQQRLTHYRETFFQQAKDQLAAKGIAFDLVYGQPDAAAQIRKDSGHLPWAHAVQEKTFRLGKFTGVWLPMPNGTAQPDLVIVTQENKLLANYAWLLRRLFGGSKVAYWGHGANFQSDAPAGLRERWKQLLLTKVDWWFAYTQMTVDIVAKAGYPPEQMTCLNNAIDTAAFKRDLAAVPEADLAAARQALGITPSAPVGIFCGSLYPDKKLDFLVDACDRIHQQSAEFHCIVLGDGPSMPILREAATSRPWLHLLGVTKGAQKALYFRMGAFMLNPGLVGLHIVDAFCAGLVMVTTTGARHSPEVCYLRDGVNGVMTRDSAAEYAQRVLALINDPAALAKLRAASLADADVYTLEKMVAQFVDGIERCLGRSSAASR
ncbi:MAG: glycosyl transferase group 1 [uncultured bacterium]|nr:MAG: glycosyl transferase group 1 [uncultured bacterium]